MLKHTRYTTGDQYTLNGANYIGYYHVENGIPYTGSSPFIKRKQLTVTRKLSVLTDLSEHDYNRTPRSQLQLPNTLEDVNLKIGSFVTGEIIENKCKLLMDNLAYIQSRLQILKFNDTHSSLLTQRNITSTYGSTTKLVDSIIIDCEFSTNKIFVYVLKNNTGTTLHAEVIDEAGIKVSDVGIQYTGDDIVSIAYTSYKLFVASKQRVVSYDLQYVIQEDSVNTLTTFIHNQIGGVGDSYSTDGYLEIDKITADTSHIFVHDSGAKCTKIYTHELAWVTTTRIGSLPIYRQLTIVDVKSNPFTSDIYILFNNGKMLIYDKNYSIKGEVDLRVTVRDINASFVKLEFIHANQNIFFVCTTTKVYQLDTSCYTILSVYASVSNVVSLSESQGIYGIAMPISSKEQNVCAISFVNEVGDNILGFYITTFSHWNLTLVDPSVWLFDDIKHPKMPLSYITINALIKQVFESHINLVKTIAFMPIVTSTDSGGFAYTGYEYIRRGNQLEIDPNSINLIGNNEQFLADVINRTFKVLIDIQNDLLSTISESTKSSVGAYNLDILV